MIHTKGKLYYNGDFALKEEGNLWTIKGLGRMVGQTPIVFTLQMPDASGEHAGYQRMILNRCMADVAEHFSLWFSWSIFDSETNEVDLTVYPEFSPDNNQNAGEQTRPA